MSSRVPLRDDPASLEPSLDQSALIVPVPDAEELVGAIREQLDPSSSVGIPAHITVLYPFMPPGRIDAGVITELSDLFGDFPRCEISLASVEWFGREVVWLAPRPDGALRHLTAAVWERWPDYPPYEGVHADPVPHLTIGDGAASELLERAAQTIAPHLPLETELTEVRLLRSDLTSGAWQPLARFPLGCNPPAHRAEFR